MELTYRELFDILITANERFAHYYHLYGLESDLDMRELTFELLSKINKSTAMFFKIEEDNPF